MAFKWEIYCCDTARVDGSAQPPTHMEEVTLLIYAATEVVAIEQARNMVDREYYQALSCEEEIPEEAIDAKASGG